MAENMNRKRAPDLEKIKSILTSVIILCVIAFTPYCVVMVANINEQEYKDIDYKKYIISPSEFGFEFDLPKKNYREVSLLFDGLTERDIDVLYSPYMRSNRVFEGDRIQAQVICDVGHGLDETFSMRSQRLEKNRTRIKHILVGEWKKKRCKGSGVIYSDAMSEELFNKMRVVVDRGDMVLGLDLRGNFIYGVFAALFYIFTLIRIYFIYYFFGLFETIKEVF